MRTATGSRGQQALITPSRRIRCWAHRGAGKTAPENTLIAIREGAARGFTAVEFDTMPTADGQWILHHDWVTGRTARLHDGQAPVSGSGAERIVAMTQSDLSRHEAGSWLSPQFAGEPIPLLFEALGCCAELGMEVNVELKLDMESGLFTAERLQWAAQSLLQVLSQSPYAVRGELADRLVVSSFGLDGLYALRAAGYAGRLAPLFETLPDNWVVHARDLAAEAIHTHHSQATAERVRRVHTTGRAFRVYTVNDADRLAALDVLGVDDCFTDNMSFSAVV